MQPELNLKQTRFSRYEFEALTTCKPGLVKYFVKQYYRSFQLFAPKDSWYNNKACLCNALSLLGDLKSPVSVNRNPFCIHLHKKAEVQWWQAGKKQMSTFCYSRLKICLIYIYISIYISQVLLLLLFFKCLLFWCEQWKKNTTRLQLSNSRRYCWSIHRYKDRVAVCRRSSVFMISCSYWKSSLCWGIVSDAGSVLCMRYCTTLNSGLLHSKLVTWKSESATEISLGDTEAVLLLASCGISSFKGKQGSKELRMQDFLTRDTKRHLPQAPPLESSTLNSEVLWYISDWIANANLAQVIAFDLNELRSHWLIFSSI